MSGISLLPSNSVDLRAHRAHELLRLIMMEIEPFLADSDRELVFEALLATFIRNGACIETDALRDDLGKEPRDSKGWTHSERIKEQMDYFDMVTTLMTHFKEIPKGSAFDVKIPPEMLDQLSKGAET